MNTPQENKEPTTTSLRISKEMAAKLAVIAAQLPGVSANSLGVSFIEAIITMLETPEAQRITPAIVMMVDSVRKPGVILVSRERPSPTEDKPTVSTRLLKKAKETAK